VKILLLLFHSEISNLISGRIFDSLRELKIKIFEILKKENVQIEHFRKSLQKGSDGIPKR
jgi:hypothetical protein